MCGVDDQPLCKKYCKAMIEDARAKRLKRAKYWKTKCLQMKKWEHKENKLRADINSNAASRIFMKQKGELCEDDVLTRERKAKNVERVKNDKVPLGI